MGRSKYGTIAIIGMLAMCVWVIAGCGGGSGSSGPGSVQISLVDAPLNASEVNVDIASVQVHSSGGGWKTVKEFATPLHVNLLDYRTSGTALLLADAPLDAGHYTMVRLMLTGAEVVVGGQTHTVDISNVQQTGVKCNGQFTVAGGERVALILDFNAGRSFVNTGGGNYKLHPVMSMSPVNIASEVSGKVEFQDANGVVQTLPADVEVNVYPVDQAGQTDALVAGTVVETDGTFKFAALMQGTYDIQIVSGDTVVKTMEDVVITAPSTSLGTIIIVPAQP